MHETKGVSPTVTVGLCQVEDEIQVNRISLSDPSFSWGGKVRLSPPT